MEGKYAIEVSSISKKFRVYHDKDTSFKDMMLFHRNNYTEHEVLKDISLDIPWGRTVGLIGKNGSGKSTLLKMLTGIMYPDSGTIRINGKIASLLELGAGFHPEFSGRENIYNNAAIFGLGKSDIDERYKSIVEFSELGEFIDNPIRTYSSGMYMRLAFSVAISVDAEIMLFDEILSVGDAAFQNKCHNCIRELRQSGKTIVIVSHSPDTIKEFCDEAIWLKDSVIYKRGDPNSIMDEYLAPGNA